MYRTTYTTDHRHLGLEFEELPKEGDALDLGDGFSFVIYNIKEVDEKTVRLSNYNYIMDLEKGE